MDRQEKLFHEGLVDSWSGVEFEKNLAALKRIWEEREAAAFSSLKSYEPSSLSGLFSTRPTKWRWGLQEEVGLGSPPTPYYTNDSELINAAIKEKVNYQKSKWPHFNAKVKELVDFQMQEADKAIIGCGEYGIRDEYKYLMVPIETWKQTTKEQRSEPYASFTLLLYVRWEMLQLPLNR